MKILFLSDLHLGLTRTANHTAESSQRRELESRKQLSAIIGKGMVGVARNHWPKIVCAGDFFDKFSNPETTIVEAIECANAFEYILSGNHDHSQRADTYSSLDLLAEVQGQDSSIVKEPSKYSIEGLWFVPHCLNQDLFVEALEQVRGKASCTEGPRILVTHCNYALPFELTSSSLNLSRALAEQLLGTFDFILLGHEHTPREDFDGRLIVIGSHFPTAFDNLTDKRHLIYDTETKSMASVVHWRAAEHVYVGPGCDALPGLQYYDLSDNSDPKLPVQLFKAGALGVRVPSSAAQQTFVHQDLPRLDLAAQIRGELADRPELLALFDELVADR